MTDYNKECNSIIIEYLLHYCYKDTAKVLLNELNKFDNCFKSLQPNSNQKDEYEHIQWDQIDARRDITSAIKEGDIGRAFSLIERYFPNLMRTYDTLCRIESTANVKKVYHTNLPKLHIVLYKLRCQQFIETLKTSGDLEAIQFAKHFLRPCNEMYPDLINSVTSLIAYNNLEDEKIKDLLSQARRDSIADEVNEMILESQQFSPVTSIEKLWRQKATLQVELDNQKKPSNLKDIENIDKIPM